MKKTLFLLSLLLTLVIVSCQRDEPENQEGLFRLTMGTMSPTEIAMGLHDADVSFKGYANFVQVNLIGTYDEYFFSDQPIPNWMTVTKEKDSFKIDVTDNDTDSAREFTLYFTVKKMHRRQSGSISITQAAITEDDMIQREQKAMSKYIKRFEVIDHLPPLTDIQPSSVSPFYKLDEEGTVYMQVVKLGEGPAVSAGETISFRYLKFDLLCFYDDNKLPAGSGNLNSGEPYEMTFGNTYTYGTGLQLPLKYGLPLGSEVNLVVSSSAGPSFDASAHIPYLYNLKYLDNK